MLPAPGAVLSCKGSFVSLLPPICDTVGSGAEGAGGLVAR